MVISGAAPLTVYAFRRVRRSTSTDAFQTCDACATPEARAHPLLPPDGRLARFYDFSDDSPATFCLNPSRSSTPVGLTKAIAMKFGSLSPCRLSTERAAKLIPMPLVCGHCKGARYDSEDQNESWLVGASACRAMTAFASRIARPSSPVRSRHSFATLAQSSFSVHVVALCVCLSASSGVHGILQASHK
jgi:hypothetical protein